MNSFFDRYFSVQTDDVLVARRGRLLNTLVLVIGLADLLTIVVDIAFGRSTFLMIEVLALVVFGVIYWFTRRGHRWPPYVFLGFMALIAPYSVQGSLASPIVLIVAVPVAVAPLIAAPWLCIPVAGVEAILLYVLSLTSGQAALNPVAVVALGVLAGASWLSSSSLEIAFREARQTASDLTETNRELQANRVLLEARTHELERESAYEQASAEVGRAATSILDSEMLMKQIVELIRKRFDLYYVGLFQVDSTGKWAVLRAGTGEAGQAMLARKHQLQIGSGSMIGWSIANQQARVALEASQDAERLATAELPDTRSEAALPLRSRDRVLGALTVQSAQAGTFDPNTIVVLQTMADQVAVALDNARLFAESQAALEVAHRAYGQLSHQAWTEMLHTRSNLGFLKSEHGVFPAGEVWQPEMEKAFRTGKAVSGPDDAMSLAAPVKVRDQVIGVIDAHKTQGEWTPAEIALVESLTEQIGVALESARLFQDSQHRAARERLLREVTARVRSSADPETVLKSLLREVGTVLGRSTFVRLGSAEQLAHSPQAASGNSRDTLSQEGN